MREVPWSVVKNSEIHIDKTLENARESVASLIKAQSKEIIFTSGGTESNNIA